MKLSESAIEPYAVDVPESILSDLYKRLENTRWSQSPDLGWDGGTDASYLREFCDYWREGYNWRNAEEKLNQLAHFRTELDGTNIHFVYERGKGPEPFPLILTHGYPDSFYRFVKLIPHLTDPAAFGGSAEDTFDVVIPDIPGYGFSDKPAIRGSTFRVSDLWARLMTDRLGYERFGAHGGDWGSTITEQHSGSSLRFISLMFRSDISCGNPMIHLPRNKRCCRK
jgi:hypothetical protein